MLLLCSLFRLKELFQVKNCLATSLLFSFFFENAKNLGRSDDAKRRKKKGWPKSKNYTLASHERDHKDLVQIWLIKNPDLSGKSRISTAFKPNKSTARSAAKNRDFKTA